MGQFGKRINTKGYSVPNPFRIELPGKIEPEALDWLVSCFRFGMATKEEIDEIFMGHVRLGLAIAGEYGWLAKHLINDLASVAMVGIAEAMNNAPTALVDNNITPFITTRIRGEIHDYIQGQHLIGSRTLRRRLVENPTWVQPYFDSLSKANDRVTGTNTGTVEILEYINYCVDLDLNLRRREYKRAVLQLRAAGYDNTEIAAILEISPSFVQSMVSTVRDEFDKEFPYYPRKGQDNVAILAISAECGSAGQSGDRSNQHPPL